ncbi:HAD-IIA family hydrolase [Halobellus rufus]|uniref:HAD-IIA family hydrolase n=1 Tax=Halobellus rufus TaxID=1448860 RepID=UPI000678B789|nr:HAD-IIA family hydrolase [Halobellus rufus]
MSVRGVLFDVDGTVLRGDEPISGAREGLEAVDAAGLSRLFVSNNPTEPPAAYRRRFEAAGFDVDPSEVLTAGAVTAEFLSMRHPDDRITVVGEPGLLSLLREEGLRAHRLTASPDSGPEDEHQAQSDGGPTPGPHSTPPDVFVASVDREFSYPVLQRSLRALSDPQVTFLGTDPDVVIPTADGPAPGSGAIIDAIANVAGRDPDAILGKPSETAQEMALGRLGLSPEDVLVVGDRLDTDIALGERAGMTTVLVRTGVTDEADLDASPIDPDYVLDSLAGLERLVDDVAVGR